MFEAFESAFARDEDLSEISSADLTRWRQTGLDGLFARFGGCSYYHSLYRVLTPLEAVTFTGWVEAAFPKFTGQLACFGYDWLGRVFALDLQLCGPDGPRVVVFDPGTAEALELVCGLAAFHDDELVRQGETVLAMSAHARWLGAGGVAPTRTQCVGYKLPLFLGGEDIAENCELIDLDVYWCITAALIRKADELPRATHVKVRFS